MLSQKIQQAFNENKSVSPVINFTGYDFLITTNKGDSGKSYQILRDSLIRLSGSRVVISTKLKDGAKKTRSFGLIDDFTIVEEKKGSLKVGMIEVVLPLWLLESIDDSNILTINPDYFRIRKAIDRRIYEISRKHCGHQKEFMITLDKLFLKSGSSSVKKEFKRSIKELSEKNDLPDYEVFLDVKTELVTFKNRNYTPKLLKTPTLEELKQSKTYHLYESVLFTFECLENKTIELSEKEIDFFNGY